jgi:hypothetical protein
MAAATSWSVLLTPNGSEKYATVATRNGTIGSGTARALPTGETGAFDYLPAVIKRCFRKILMLRADGTIPADVKIGFQITVGSNANGPTYTGSVQTGAVVVSGGTTITAPLADGSTAVDLMFALNQGERRIKSDFATNG